MIRRATRAVCVALAAALLVGGVVVGSRPADAAVHPAAGATSSGGSAGLSAALASIGGSIDPRTGLLTFQLDVGAVAGPADSGMGLSAAFSQQLAAGGVDYFGLGAGWLWNSPYFDVDAGEVVLGGQPFRRDASQPSGLADYRLQDVTFTSESGTVPTTVGASESGDPVDFTFVLHSNRDGGTHYFDANGDLVGVADRFGHVTTLVWDVVGDTHRLQTITGPYGQQLAVTWSGSSITVTAPLASGQTAGATTTLGLSGGRLASVADSAGLVTRISWSDPVAGMRLPATVQTPTGAVVEFTYLAYAAGTSGQIAAVDTARVVDSSGALIADEVTFSLDPDGENGGRNWTGAPIYADPSAAANSGDAGFTYRVRVTDSTGGHTEYTYDALGRVVETVNRVMVGSQAKDASRTELTYPGQNPDGSPPKARTAPANYQTPSMTTVVTTDPNNPSRTRKVEVATEHDSLGRIVKQVRTSSTGERLTTDTAYGPNSIATHVVTTDAATGTRRVTATTTTPDGLAPQTITTSAATGSGPVSTVSVQGFEYHSGVLAGEVKRSMVSGDPAAPGGSPGTSVTTTDTVITGGVGNTAGTRTTVTTGADGVAATTVVDLASGQVLTAAIVGQGQSTTRYDRAGRVIEQITADGVTTTIAYEIGDGRDGGLAGARTTATRTSDGFATRTTTDPLGRQVRSESNYRPSTDSIGDWRIVTAEHYNTAGQRSESIDANGQVTAYGYDSAGRPASVTGPDGTVQSFVHDAIAGSTTTLLTLPGESTPIITNVSSVDDQGNEIANRTSYRDGSATQELSTTFDGFNQPVQTGGSGPARYDYTYSPAGIPVSATIVTDGGATTRATFESDAFGARTGKTLTEGPRSVLGWSFVYDAAGRVVSMTAPGAANPIRPTYDPSTGQITSTVQPDGAVDHARYDGLGRVVESWTVTSAQPGVQQSHVLTEYDGMSGAIAAVWFADRPDAGPDGSKITFTYHRDGSVKSRTDPGGRTTTYRYTDSGQLAEVTDAAGVTTRYEYQTVSGRLEAATQIQAGVAIGAVNYRYDGAGRPIETRYIGANSTPVGVSSWTYADTGTLSTEKHLDHAGQTVAEHVYTYTVRGQVETDVATVRSAADATPQTTSTRHRYDDTAHLVETTETQGSTPGVGEPVSQSHYVYDLVGNLGSRILTTHDVATGTVHTSTSTFEHDGTFRTIGVTTDGEHATQSYDAAGRLVEGADGSTYEYDAARRLVAITTADGLRVENEYNPLGERVRQSTRRSAGPTADESIDQINYLPGIEIDPSTGHSVSYLDGLTREARTLLVAPGAEATADTSWYVTNRRGDKTHTLTGAGLIADHRTWTDHGVARSDGSRPLSGSLAADPYGYAGQYTDPTGLQPLGSRWYVPGIGALTTPDTPSAGMFNPYTYAAGDPVNFVDPTGQSPEATWRWIKSNVLDWAGLPYVEFGLSILGAGLAVAAAVGSGGAAIPVIIAAAAVSGAVLTTVTAADQLARHADPTGVGFLGEHRTAMNVASALLALGEVGVGIYSGLKLFRGTRAVTATAPPLRGPGTFREAALQPDYYGEASGHPMAIFFGKVHYLDDTARAPYKLTVRDGKLYDAADRPFDTTFAQMGHRNNAGKAIYVMAPDGTVYANINPVMGRFHHSSFLAGGKVAGAGEITVRNGKLTGIGRFSGHYKPTSEMQQQVLDHLRTSGLDMSHLANISWSAW